MNKIIMADRTVVHCPTLEDAKKVFAIVFKNEKQSYNKYVNYWNNYKENICYNINFGTYADKEYFLDKNYNVISTQQFLRMNGKIRSMRL